MQVHSRATSPNNRRDEDDKGPGREKGQHKCESAKESKGVRGLWKRAVAVAAESLAQKVASVTSPRSAQSQQRKPMCGPGRAKQLGAPASTHPTVTTPPAAPRLTTPQAHAAHGKEVAAGAAASQTQPAAAHKRGPHDRQHGTRHGAPAAAAAAAAAAAPAAARTSPPLEPHAGHSGDTLLVFTTDPEAVRQAVRAHMAAVAPLSILSPEGKARATSSSSLGALPSSVIMAASRVASDAATSCSPHPMESPGFGVTAAAGPSSGRFNHGVLGPGNSTISPGSSLLSGTISSLTSSYGGSGSSSVRDLLGGGLSASVIWPEGSTAVTVCSQCVCTHSDLLRLQLVKVSALYEGQQALFVVTGGHGNGLGGSSMFQRASMPFHMPSSGQLSVRTGIDSSTGPQVLRVAVVPVETVAQLQLARPFAQFTAYGELPWEMGHDHKRLLELLKLSIKLQAHACAHACASALLAVCAQQKLPLLAINQLLCTLNDLSTGGFGLEAEATQLRSLCMQQVQAVLPNSHRAPGALDAGTWELLSRLARLAPEALHVSLAAHILSALSTQQGSAQQIHLYSTCLERVLQTFGNAAAAANDATILSQFCELPFEAVLAWIGSSDLMTDSENTVVWMLHVWWTYQCSAHGASAPPSRLEAQAMQLAAQVRVQLLSPVYTHVVLPQLPWFRPRGRMMVLLSAKHSGLLAEEGEIRGAVDMGWPSAWLSRTPRVAPFVPVVLPGRGPLLKAGVMGSGGGGAMGGARGTSKAGGPVLALDVPLERVRTLMGRALTGPPGAFERLYGDVVVVQGFELSLMLHVEAAADHTGCIIGVYVYVRRDRGPWPPTLGIGLSGSLSCQQAGAHGEANNYVRAFPPAITATGRGFRDFFGLGLISAADAMAEWVVGGQLLLRAQLHQLDGMDLLVPKEAAPAAGAGAFAVSHHAVTGYLGDEQDEKECGWL